MVNDSRTPSRSHRILFSFRSLWYLKFYECVLRRLAERGHSVHVLVDHGEGNPKVASRTRAMESLTREYPSITFGWAPRRVGDPYVDLCIWIRRTLGYLHFLRREFDDAPALRARAASRAPRALIWLGRLPAPWRSLAGRGLECVLMWLEPATTSVGALRDVVSRVAPDAVVVTPLVTLGSAQFDILRLARAAGTPTAFAVASWDHLSSKALIRVMPDRVFVWNDTQRREAVRYHSVPDERVVVTGAQCFDEWFERQPSQPRSHFCHDLGLPENRPLLLYVCSALFPDSPSEAGFVARWVRAIRDSPDDRVRSASIVVRPHPKRSDEWSDVHLNDFADVAVWPPRGQAPLGAEAKSAYFDSLYHSAATVGLNTSALIEAGILGRPVYTVLLPEFWSNQEGTLHFTHLLSAGGGLLHAARSLDDHVRQLAVGLANPPAAAARNRCFVEAFIRPRGLDASGTETFVNALEELTGLQTSRADTAHSWTPLTRVLLWPLARVLRNTAPGTSRLWRQPKRRRRRPRVDLLTESSLSVWVWRCRWILRPGGQLGRSRFRKDKFWRAVRSSAYQRAEASRQAKAQRVAQDRRNQRMRNQAAQRAAWSAYKRRRTIGRRWQKEPTRWMLKALVLYRRWRGVSVKGLGSDARIEEQARDSSHEIT